jgi:TolB protein
VRIADGKEQIHVMHVDGSGDEAISPDDVRAIHPTFSHDAKTLAYCTDDDLHPPKKNASDIVFVDLATRRATTVITGGVNTYPAFSPDGQRLAFRRMLGETNSEVFVADVDGKHATNLTKSPAFDGWPRWSPDGRWIAFASNKSLNTQIYVMRPDGTEVHRVAPTEGRATAPVWSPDGRLIYFPNCYKVDFSYDCQIFVARAPA